MKSSFYALMIIFILILGIPFLIRAEDPIKIAAIYAVTGVAAEANTSSLKGVRFAVDEINKHGGILGKKLELLVFDNKSTPIGSKMAADRAVQAKVTAIIGAAWSSHSIAIARVAQVNGIPMITNISTHPSVTKIGNFIFRVCFTDSLQSRLIAEFVRNELHAETAVVLIDLRSDYSMGLGLDFREHFERMRGKVLLEIPYKQKQRDFTNQLIEAGGVNPDIIFIPGHGESGLIAKQAQDLDIPAICIGGDGWGIPDFMKMGGSTLKLGYYITHWAEEVGNKPNREFLKQSRQFYDDVNDNFALSCDAVYILADAIRRAGSLDREKIRELLSCTKNFQGVTGKISFDENGDPMKNAVVMKISNGKIVYLKTITNVEKSP